MGLQKIINGILQEKGLTQKQLATVIGLKSQSTIAEKLQTDMRISGLIKIANALGYDVCLVKKKPGPKSSDVIVLEANEK